MGSQVWWGRSDYIVFEATGQFYSILSRMELKQYMEQLHDGKWFDKQYHAGYSDTWNRVEY